MNTAKSLGAAVVALLVLGTGAYAGVNTNLFGPEQLCHDMADESTVQSALPGPGRLSNDDMNGLSCEIRRSSLGMGDEDTVVELRLTTEEARFPFVPGLWEMTGATDVFDEKSRGAVDSHGGWVLLPVGCSPRGSAAGPGDPRAEGGRTVLRATVTSGETDLAGMARLLGGVGQNLAAEHNCGSQQPRPTVRLVKASAERDTNKSEICAVPGFKASRLEPYQGRPVEQTSGELDSSAWFCDLSFADAQQPYTRFAVVQDSHLASGVVNEIVRPPYKPGWRGNSAPGYTAVFECLGKRTFFMMDTVDFPWTPGERAKAGLVTEDEFFSRFVMATADAKGCAPVTSS